MSDIIRKLLKAEAPKTISKEQLFVYVPQDYHGAVADTAEAAAEAAKGAQLSLQYAIGKKYRAFETTANLEFDDFEKFLAKVHFKEDYYNFHKYNGKWYIGDVTNGNLVTLEEYGIKPSSVRGDRVLVGIDVGNVDEGEEGHKDNSEYYAGLAEQAKIAAAAAQGKAETAQGKAETAQGKAETAQGKAETAQTKAETARTKAEEAQGKAETARDDAEEFSLVSEGYASGTENGEPVGTDSPYHQNNAAYYAEVAEYHASHPVDGSVSKETLDADLQSEIEGKLNSSPVPGTPLITNGKIDTSYIPDSVLGQVEYQGLWSASTGISPFPGSLKRKGNYWICFVGGDKNPDGSSTFGVEYDVGDWAILSPGILGNLIWTKVDNTDAVTMVNGHKGAVNTYVGEVTSGSTYNAGDTVLYGGNLYLVITQFTFNGSNFLSNVKRYGLSDEEVEDIRDQIPADVLSNKITGSDIIHADLSEDEREVIIHFDITDAQNGQVPVYNNGNVHWGNGGGGSVDARRNVPVRYTFENCRIVESDTSLYIVAGTQAIVKLQAEEGYTLPSEVFVSSGLTATIDTSTGVMEIYCSASASGAIETVTVTAIVPSLDTFLLTSNDEYLLDADNKNLVF